MEKDSKNNTSSTKHSDWRRHYNFQQICNNKNQQQFDRINATDVTSMQSADGLKNNFIREDKTNIFLMITKT